MKDGRTLGGTPVGQEAGFVLIEIELDDGSVTHRVSPSQIETIIFLNTSPTEETELLSTAQLEALCQPRIPLLGVLSADDEHLCIQLLEAYRNNKKAALAIDLAKLWEPKILDPQNTLALLETLIKSCLDLHRSEEAAFHAQRWIREFGYVDDNALPWTVVAQSLLDQHHPSEALQLALYPIAKQSNASIEYLNTCYEIAISACRDLGLTDYAAALAREAEFPRHPQPVSSAVPPPFPIHSP